MFNIWSHTNILSFQNTLNKIYNLPLFMSEGLLCLLAGTGCFEGTKSAVKYLKIQIWTSDAVLSNIFSKWFLYSIMLSFSA